MSISSVNEEEDESASLLSERCRYISVSEEDELLAFPTSAAEATVAGTAITTVAATTSTEAAVIAATATQAQSVITEQPTASRKLKLDLLLASADILTHSLTPQQHPTQKKQSEDNSKGAILSESAATQLSDLNPIQVTDAPVHLYVPPATATATTAATTTTTTVSAEVIVVAVEPSTTGTAHISEDSDEYRSLEGKDDVDLSVSE